jgi:MFS family permease
MSITNIPPATLQPASEVTGWRSLTLLNRYHWFVFVVAALGWLADCLDQQLFVLAKNDAMQELLPAGTPFKTINYYGTVATSIFMIGWATGGLAFGILGDVIGRVKTMLITIGLYSVFTGVSSFSVGPMDFMIYRFLTGLGVGGEFAVGVALLAETMPDRARPYTLGMLQAFSAFGNITAALLYMWVGRLEQSGTFTNLYVLGVGPITAWRLLFVLGTAPALLALVVRGRLREPERWRAAVADQAVRERLGNFPTLLTDPGLRRSALLGLMLTFAGVVGLWGIGFFSPQLTMKVLEPALVADGLSGEELGGAKKVWGAWTGLMANLGAFFGMFAFSWLTSHVGRRPAFAVSFILAMLSTALVFTTLSERSDIFWMIPLMGFCQLSLFGGYAIYLPELFPTRLRSTGTSFCYNVGRFVSAVGPFFFGLLTTLVFTSEDGMRYAGLTMCSVFVLGLVALVFLPETKGKPLPE